MHGPFLGYPPEQWITKEGLAGITFDMRPEMWTVGKADDCGGRAVCDEVAARVDHRHRGDNVRLVSVQAHELLPQRLHVEPHILPGHRTHDQVHGFDRAGDMLLERPRVVFRLPQRGLQLPVAGHLCRLQRGNPDGRNCDQRERDDRGARGEQSQRGGDNPIAGMQVIHDLGVFSGGCPVRRHQPRFPSVRRSLSQVPHSSAINGREK